MDKTKENLQSIDTLTTNMQKELQELRAEYVLEIGSKGRIDSMTQAIIVADQRADILEQAYKNKCHCDHV